MLIGWITNFPAKLKQLIVSIKKLRQTIQMNYDRPIYILPLVIQNRHYKLLLLSYLEFSTLKVYIANYRFISLLGIVQICKLAETVAKPGWRPPGGWRWSAGGWTFDSCSFSNSSSQAWTCCFTFWRQVQLFYSWFGTRVTAATKPQIKTCLNPLQIFFWERGIAIFGSGYF